MGSGVSSAWTLCRTTPLPSGRRQIRNDQLTNDGNGAREKLAPDVFRCQEQLTQCVHIGLARGALRSPSHPRYSPPLRGEQAGGAAAPAPSSRDQRQLFVVKRSFHAGIRSTWRAIAEVSDGPLESGARSRSAG